MSPTDTPTSSPAVGMQWLDSSSLNAAWYRGGSPRPPSSTGQVSRAYPASSFRWCQRAAALSRTRCSSSGTSSKTGTASGPSPHRLTDAVAFSGSPPCCSHRLASVTKSSKSGIRSIRVLAAHLAGRRGDGVRRRDERRLERLGEWHRSVSAGDPAHRLGELLEECLMDQ